jgi:retron-type reverse transcriptase
VIAVYKKYVRIARTWDTDVKYKRVAIPKSDAKYRPLGVPEMEWRIYLGLVNKLLFMWVRDLISANQHGFQSKKGTLSAWKSIILEVVHYRNIWEFDLEKFFDTVDLTLLVRHVYRKYGISQQLAKQLYLLNLNLPVGMIFLWANSFMGELSEEAKKKLRKLASFGDDPDFLSFVANSEERYYTHWVGLKDCKILRPLKFNGVGQGLPTSPLLSILILEELIFKRIKGSLMYADDGMFYSNNDEAIEKLIKSLEREPYIGAGVRLSLNKCSWVKRKNTWLKPLKFLGLELDGANWILKANTRKGSFLVYSMESLIDLVRQREELIKEESPEDRSKWREPVDSLASLVSSTVYGLIQSRLYAGSYTLENLVQDFDMSFRKGSWISKWDWRKRLSVFISTSFATKSLANTIKGLKVKCNHGIKDRESWEEFYYRVMLHGYRLAMIPQKGITKRVKTFQVKDPQWTSMMLVFTPIYKSNNMVLDWDHHLVGGLGWPWLEVYEEPNSVLLGLLSRESSEYEKYAEEVVRASRQRANYQNYILSD